MSKCSFARKLSVALACIVSLGSSLHSKGFVFRDGSNKLYDSKTTKYEFQDVSRKDLREVEGMFWNTRFYRLPDGRVVDNKLFAECEQKEENSNDFVVLTTTDLNVPEHPLIKRMKSAKRSGDKLFFLPLKKDPKISLLVQRSPDGEKKIVLFYTPRAYGRKCISTVKFLSGKDFKQSLKTENDLEHQFDTKYFVTENLSEFVGEPDEDILNWAKNNGIETSYSEQSENNSGSAGMLYGLFGLGLLSGLLGLTTI